jgi:DinB family
MDYFEKNHRVTAETCRLSPRAHWHWKPTESVCTAGRLLYHIAYSQRAMTEWAVRANFEWRFEEATRWQLAEGMMDHETHHRGQWHTYLRLLGVEGKALAPIFHHVCFLKVGIA